MAWSPIKTQRLHTVPLPRQEVWRLLSETDHLNRVIGLFPVNFSTVRRHQSGLYRIASAKVAHLIPIKWREYPFQWVMQQEHVVERIYESGPLIRFLAGIELLDDESSLHGDALQTALPTTRIRLYAEVTPRNLLGYIATHLVGSKSMRKTIQYLDKHFRTQQAASSGAQPLPRPQSNKRYTVNTVELERLLHQLSKSPVPLNYVNIIREIITTCDDDEVMSIRPYEWAHYLQVDRHEVLRLCLYATKAGILNLSWNMMCPNCRVSKFQTMALMEVGSSFHCDFCGIQYEANFDSYVELRFSVHPNIRVASESIFCIGGPAITPHVLVQRCIEASGSTTIRFPDTSENLRIRSLQTNHIVRIGDMPSIHHHSASHSLEESACSESLVSSDISVVCLRYTDGGWNTAQIPTPTADTDITIYNDSTEAVVIDLERVKWSDHAVTAAEVTAMQEFRDLFSSEVLAPGQQVGIQNVTIFFSDLRGSTAMYEHIGDAPAYGHVRRHFDFLNHWISKNSGGLVKTIGDAVMAVFHRPQQAIQAALDIQQHVRQFTEDVGESIDIKIGIHTGPAIAVNSNDRLDYFGRTVNIAARVQGCSLGGDIVLAEETCYLVEVQEILDKYSVGMIRFRAQLKGIDEDFDLVRINPSDTVI